MRRSRIRKVEETMRAAVIHVHTPLFSVAHLSAVYLRSLCKTIVYHFHKYDFYRFVPYVLPLR